MALTVKSIELLIWILFDQTMFYAYRYAIFSGLESFSSIRWFLFSIERSKQLQPQINKILLFLYQFVT